MNMDNQDDNDQFDAMRDEINALKAELAALKAQPVQEPWKGRLDFDKWRSEQARSDWYGRTMDEMFATFLASQTCTCPSGDGSLRWPCPVHWAQPVQDPVAYVIALPDTPIGVSVPVSSMARLEKMHNAPLYLAPVAQPVQEPPDSFDAVLTWCESNGIPLQPEQLYRLVCYWQTAIVAAREAQPVQEPIALLHDDGFWSRINTPAGRAFANKRPLPATKVYAAPVQPAPQQEVWYVGSKTFTTLFATKEAADKFCSQFPASVGIWPERMAVIGGAG